MNISTSFARICDRSLLGFDEECKLLRSTMISTSDLSCLMIDKCIYWWCVCIGNYQAEKAQNIYGVFCVNTNVTVFWRHLYDNTYFLRNTSKHQMNCRRLKKAWIRKTCGGTVEADAELGELKVARTLKTRMIEKAKRKALRESSLEGMWWTA